MKLKLRQLVRPVICLIVLVVLCQTVAWGCPTCKEGLASTDPDQANMVRGYFWSILFMMSMPFLILGGLGTYFYLMIRRVQAEQPPRATPVSEFAFGTASD